MTSRYSLAARALLWSQVAVMGALWVLQGILGKDLHAVERVFWGYDYNDFHRAAQVWRAGRDIYGLPRFLTPPTSAALFLPFAHFRMKTVRPAVAGATTLALLGAFALVGRIFSPASARQSVFWLGVGTLFLSYPFLFLFDRLNVDGFVMGFVGVFLWALWREEGSPRWSLALLAGAALSLAVGVKLYPALLVLPLLLARRWRVLVGFALGMGIQIICFAHFWNGFLHRRLIGRAQYFALDENGSLANTLRFFGVGMASVFGPHSALADAGRWIGAAPYLWGALLLFKGVADGKRVLRARKKGEAVDSAALVVWYFPFMIAVPKTVYPYEFVGLWLMIPAMGAALAQEGRALRVASWLAVAGLILSQTHAVAFKNLFNSLAPHFVPGFGLFLILLASTARSGLLARRALPRKSEE